MFDDDYDLILQHQGNLLLIAAAGLIVGLIIWRWKVTQKLDDAVQALVAETAETNGKLDSIETFVRGVPELVATAVADALANANVADDAAADAIDAARAAISDKVDETLDAINANPAPGDQPAADTGGEQTA